MPPCLRTWGCQCIHVFGTCAQTSSRRRSYQTRWHVDSFAEPSTRWKSTSVSPSSPRWIGMTFLITICFTTLPQCFAPISSTIQVFKIDSCYLIFFDALSKIGKLYKLEFIRASTIIIEELLVRFRQIYPELTGCARKRAVSLLHAMDFRYLYNIPTHLRYFAREFPILCVEKTKLFHRNDEIIRLVVSSNEVSRFDSVLCTPTRFACLHAHAIKLERLKLLMQPRYQTRQQYIDSKTPIPQFIDDAITVNTYMSTVFKQDILEYSEQLTGLYAESHLLVKTSCTSRRARGE